MSNDTKKQIEMPFFKLFIKDEMANVGLFGMDAEDYGVFCLLRNFIWAKGFLPSEKKILAKNLKISAKKFEKIWEKISPLFFDKDGKLLMPELETQRAKYIEFIEKSREGGKKSAENRSKVGSTSVEGGLKVAPSSTEYIAHSTNSNSQNAESTNTKSNALASQSAENVCVADSPKSNFSMEEIGKYVLACQNAGQEIKSPIGLSTTLFQTGNADLEIDNFLKNGKIISLKKSRSEKLREAGERAKAKV